MFLVSGGVASPRQKKKKISEKQRRCLNLKNNPLWKKRAQKADLWVRIGPKIVKFDQKLDFLPVFGHFREKRNVYFGQI